MKEKILISICLILVITYTAFYPSLESDFVNWDDHVMVKENARIRSLSLENIKNLFCSFHESSLYHPLVDLSYAIEYYFFKLTPLACHTTNLILHMSNCLLVFWVIFLLSSKISVSLITALLFGIHPLHVESVAWITERKDVLYGFFFLGGLISYIFNTKRPEKKYYYISVFLFILSLLSKSMAMTFPFVLLLCDYILNRKFEKERLKEKYLFFIISGLFIVFTFYGLSLSKSFIQAPLMQSYYYIFFANYGFLFYISKFVMPFKLSSFYPYPEDINNLLLFLILPAMTIVLTLLVIISKRYTKKIIFGNLFFLITILPVLQIFPSSRSITADRYTYIPLIGLCYIAAQGFFFLYFKKIRYKKILKTSLLIMLIAIMASLSYLTSKRCLVWKDSIALWNDLLKKLPDLSFAYSNRAHAYLSKKEYDKAISDYNKAISLSPDVATAYVNRAGAYTFKKEYDKAISDYTKAINIDSNYALAYNWRGVAYAEKGDYKHAIPDYNEALMIDPEYAAAYINLGNAYKTEKKYGLAISNYSKAIKIAPNYAEAYNNRGNVYSYLGDWDMAISDYYRALKNDPNCPQAYNNLAVGYFEKKDYNRAWKNLHKARDLGCQIESEFLERLRKDSKRMK